MGAEENTAEQVLVVQSSWWELEMIQEVKSFISTGICSIHF